MTDTSARIFKIESLNTHNGPGYRTVVYLKGCPLSCTWCHNPEGISRNPEIWINNNTCIGCESCVEKCPMEALSLTQNGIKIDRALCNGCFDCAEVCPSKSIEKLGEEISVDHLFNRLMEDKAFMDSSGGGITMTGGEPGEYADFIRALFIKCRDAGIHTAFDTSGYVSERDLDKILPYTDLLFFDLKILNVKKAKNLTGKGIRRILKSLQIIKNYIRKNNSPELQIRTPIIPDSTDDWENLNDIAQLLENEYHGFFTKWELCLFNDICEDKYEKMSVEWKFKNKKYLSCDFNRISEIQKVYDHHHIEFSGFVSN